MTSQLPFAARTFSELRDALSRQPTPPGQLRADIPPALDALVMELLQIDPARRCRSAAEVMQRLAAIAGLESLESNDVSQAYIATPVLVGREAELRRFRQRLRRTLQGEGAALCFEAAAGLGRSRLLDASVLEAKTNGALLAFWAA